MMQKISHQTWHHARGCATALALILTAQGAMAEQMRQGCALINGQIPANCRQANAGTVIDRPVQPNLEMDAATAATSGDLGFSISIDPVGTSPTADGRRVMIAGDTITQGTTRDMDRLFEQMGLQMTYDGLGARPMLNVATADLRRSYAARDVVAFRAFSNYPAWIAKAEVRVTERGRPGQVVAVLPVAANGVVNWAMPGDGADRLSYSLRVYDTSGRFDETVALPLDRTAQRFDDPILDGPIAAAGEAQDRTARRGIPVRGGAITVTGQDVPAGAMITVMGEPIVQDVRRDFVVQRILPPGMHTVRVGVNGRGTVIERPVEVKSSEWFSTGLVDVTLGRDLVADNTYSYGRIAGFARGVVANGTRYTAMIDTDEQELGDLFRDLTRKNPDQLLRQLEPGDVFVTMGDDSVVEDLAPTSGKLFLRAERARSHLMWGDFKSVEDPNLMVRSDRALYGISGQLAADGSTANGDARWRIAGHAAQPDTLVQRDTFRATGGTSYFLARQDVQKGSETLLVELRDPLTNRVVETRRLVQGQDYRIDYIQGVILLDRALQGSASGPGLISGRPLGDFDVNLVVQYEYVPTTGSVDGLSAGARAEVWATDQVRFGLSGVKQDSGVTDTQLFGADILYRRSEDTFVSLTFAQSEGPGFGNTLSLNGGMEIITAPATGALGARASAVRVEGRVDLAEFGGDGYVSGYFDRKDAGFSAPDQSATVDEQSAGIEGRMRVTSTTELTFGAKRFEDGTGKNQTDLRIGAAVALSDTLALEAEIARTDRTTPGSTVARDNGSRTDLGAKLTWTQNADVTYWLFGQAAVQRSGGIEANNRLGIGMERRISDALSFSGEVSGGNLGAAGMAQLAYSPNAGTSYTLGYRLDPLRSLDSTSMTGRDAGTVVLGAQSQVNDQLSYRAENSYSSFGSEPTLATSYGLTYTPSDRWSHDATVVFGDTLLADGSKFTRAGLSYGLRYSEGDAVKASLRGEVRSEKSDSASRDLNRQTYLLSGSYDRRANENWRFLMNFDAVVSDSDQSSFRDGRYTQVKLGYAYRPVENDRVNALLSYTYLDDMPGPDQVNVDGDVAGDRQRSHILNAAISYDLNQQFTLGAKYGFRLRNQAARGSTTFTGSEAHLGVLRLDYHVVYNWDMLVEGRAMYSPGAGSTDMGALVGVYRHVGNNLRLGLGYEWGAVSDDLRSIKADREGVFLNLVGSF